jgi:hypothetical protein
MWAPHVGPSHVSIHSGFRPVGTWMTPEAKFRDPDDTRSQVQRPRNGIFKVEGPR